MRLLFVAMAMLIAHTTVAQEKRNYRDIAFDYLLQNISSIEARPWSVKADHYDKLSNGGYLVKLTIARTLTRQEDRLVNNQVQAYGATFNVGVRNATVNINYEDTKSYFVFVDRFGEASKYMEASTNHEIHTWGGNAWLLMNTHKERVGNKELSYFSNAVCFSNKGETMWSGRDMKIYGWAFSGNTLYLVGTLWDNGRSIVRSIDIKTQEANDKVGNSGVIPSDIAFGEKGLTITQYARNGQSSDFVFPYAASDRQFQIDQVLKSYDLTKATDQIALGERYLSGNVVDKDEKKAVELFEKAANQNSDMGMLKLADCYKKGVGVTQDNAKAFSLYEKSANMGNTDAMIALSDMYARGDGIEKNMSKALFWKEKLAFKGNINAQKFILANQSVEYEKADITADEAYKKGRDSYMEKSYEWAKFCFERAISLGSKDAMFDFGKILYVGEGIERNYSKAVELLSKIGEEYNHVGAQLCLAQMYKENKGIPHDIKKVIYWTTKAAENDDETAMVALAYYYKYSDEVKKNKKLSFQYCERAAIKGNQDAIREMVFNHAQGDGTKKDKYSALTWFEKMDDSEMQMKVADNFFNGVGVKENEELAALMYQSMSDKGDIIATKKLALCYLSGSGVDSNINTAYDLAMKIRNTTHVGDDADIYYIEGAYYDSKLRGNQYGLPNGFMQAKEAYERAIKCGHPYAAKALARMKSKWGIR